MFYLTPGVVDVSMMEHNHEEHTRRFWVRPEDLYQVRLVLLGSHWEYRRKLGWGEPKGGKDAQNTQGARAAKTLNSLACLPQPACHRPPALARLP